MTQPLLEVKDLVMRFGGLRAVNQVSLDVQEGQIVSLIGPNGAGKTTVFNCISGFYKPSAGEVIFKGKPMHRLPGHLIARHGMVRTFQNIRLFKEMTVLENLLVAQHMQAERNLLKGLLNLTGYQSKEQELEDRSAEWLERVNLIEFANREAGTLAYGQQRRLEIARCMVTQPTLLMLDEPAAGLNPQETQDLDQLIMELRDKYKVTLLLIEHDMKLVMGISDQIVVINQGAPLAKGTPAEILGNQDVIKAYLGEE
ncbi:high-affinity branched-chain amino acid ABC transporter ATP-binding protein LivG [Marinospirillum insulare]|uniref:ABC transporter ATP-binding protein n=1 Tax=Marinospirillum insulare TaxID=217169 RepID=A0ABQ5ZUN5_9GAMM|nr:high-affinity branched-chain amino acid ABC transporter ATP-binding protein LivG [Marinospirillum insulare]GLR62757.1 ABC transporter ATP-binding protein [Marinospirillum insulare]